MERLKILRKKKGLLQKDIAEYLGISRTTYVKWENGLHEPAFNEIEKLADYFNVSVDYLLGRSDIPNAANPAVANKDTLSQKKKDIIEKLMLLSDEDLEILEAAADAIIARRDK